MTLNVLAADGTVLYREWFGNVAALRAFADEFEYAEVWQDDREPSVWYAR